VRQKRIEEIREATLENRGIDRLEPIASGYTRELLAELETATNTNKRLRTELAVAEARAQRAEDQLRGIKK
jgi:hypothetical protein